MSIRRDPVLDGVRGVAILLVFAGHTTPALLAGGRIGVDLFFVLSGFLITSILLNEYRECGAINLSRFYARRALRLLPALALLLLSVVALAAAFEPAKLPMTLADAQAAVFFYFNWLLVRQWPDLNLHQWMFTHIWSLSVEEQFYLVWPLLTLGLLRARAPDKAVLCLIGAGIILPAIARAILWRSGISLDLYFRTDLRFDGLMWGALVAWIMHLGYRPPAGQTRYWGWAVAAGIAGLIWIARYEVLVNGLLYRGVFSLVGFCAALAIAGLQWCAPGAPIRRVLAFGPLCWVGRISYGLYLWHWPVFLAFSEYPFGHPALKIPIEFATTFVMATASFYLVERHFLQLKDRLDSKPSATTSAV